MVAELLLVNLLVIVVVVVVPALNECSQVRVRGGDNKKKEHTDE